MFSAVNVGAGALLVLAVVALTLVFSLFKEMTWGVFLFMFAVAILDKYTEGRKKT